jgi:hypothetical protein
VSQAGVLVRVSRVVVRRLSERGATADRKAKIGA